MEKPINGIAQSHPPPIGKCMWREREGQASITWDEYATAWLNNRQTEFKWVSEGVLLYLQNFGRVADDPHY